MNLQIMLSDMLHGCNNLYFIPVAATHDSEYNFGAVETPVNQGLCKGVFACGRCSSTGAGILSDGRLYLVGIGRYAGLM